MKLIFTFFKLNNISALLLLLVSVSVIDNGNLKAATKTWVGYGAGGSITQTDITAASNWSGSSPLLTTDDYVMNLTPAATFTLTQGSGISTFNSLAINFTAAGANIKEHY